MRPARDIPYPGTISLTVDATDVDARHLPRAVRSIPVAPAGRLTLLYPEWLPGNHAPRGPIDDVAGYRFIAGGEPLTWKPRSGERLCDPSRRARRARREVVAEFQYLSPTAPAQGRVVMTPDMLNLQWNLVASLSGRLFTRRIAVDATAILPAGWRYGTALEPVDPAATGTVAFKPVDFDDLVNSPMFAGRHFRQRAARARRARSTSSPTRPRSSTPRRRRSRRTAHWSVRRSRLFGSQHYDHYDFLLAISDGWAASASNITDRSENGVGPGYFTEWDEQCRPPQPAAARIHP